MNQNNYVDRVMNFIIHINKYIYYYCDENNILIHINDMNYHKFISNKSKIIRCYLDDTTFVDIQKIINKWISEY